MTKYIGFGHNCDVTEIMTRGGIRQESYPFDWTSSYPSDIRKSLDADFADWLNPKYLSLITNSTSGKIVTSHSHYNSNDRAMELRGEDKIVVFFNHHNLLDPIDRAKVNRRIRRYRNVLKSDEQVVLITNAGIDKIREAGLDTYYMNRGNARIVYLEHNGPGKDTIKLNEINNDIVISYTSDQMHGDNISKMICKELVNIFGD